jgi:hypothetical protein
MMVPSLDEGKGIAVRRGIKKPAALSGTGGSFDFSDDAFLQVICPTGQAKNADIPKNARRARLDRTAVLALAVLALFGSFVIG